MSRFQTDEQFRPHPEERRFLAARLGGWPQAWPSNPAILRDARERAPQDEGFIFFTQAER